jgi:DNA-binding CsgD family transcriptional regulator
LLIPNKKIAKFLKGKIKSIKAIKLGIMKKEKSGITNILAKNPNNGIKLK